MKRVALLSLLVVGFSQISMAQQPTQLVGTWNVTATPTCDFNFAVSPKAGANAYIWIVASVSGEVSVSVQGETSFPKLQRPGVRPHGYWILKAQTE